jgi:hypothetical protein
MLRIHLRPIDIAAAKGPQISPLKSPQRISLLRRRDSGVSGEQAMGLTRVQRRLHKLGRSVSYQTLI